MADPDLKIDWNLAGFHEIRQAPGVRADLERRGKAVLDACGGTAGGYAMSSHQGAASPEGRWRVVVYAATIRAKYSNARHNTLVRNFGAGRG